MKKATVLIALCLLMLQVVVADPGHAGDIPNTQAIIDAKIPCDEITESELEQVGEYYLGNMLTAEAHSNWEKKLASENSESLRQVHLVVGQNFYCGESSRSSHGIFGGHQGILGGWHGALSIVYVAVGAFLFGLIFWWTKKLVFGTGKKRKR